MGKIKTRDGHELYVKDWGSGRPVILIHGWPLSADSWDDQAFALANFGFRVIAYDRRGFGRSDQPWTGYDYDTLSDDLADVIEATGVTDTAIIGFSMGGGEVARYMSRHGGKNISKAGLIASVVPYMLQTSDNPDGVPQSVFDDILNGLKEDRAKFFAGFFKDFYGVGLLSSPVSNELLQASFNTAIMSGLKPAIACVQAFSSTDFRPDLASFNVPTLIIHGSDDKTVPVDASGRKAAVGIAGAQYLEYEGAPHGLFATHKEQFTRDLLAFLNQ
ncbi:alpha/beta hydrolase [Rhizobium sp. CFBP 8762]|uniref:alpha/beta fold hydrolase n=1 Tax=Rhizobium sp. CFBP 8762 TaxID=2775279 RepID=UPI00177DE822|nr:alpha/beta hydrolase [Rhizobium sp. CFBP 8762]MBD8553286.1 alpha/beta hydrolase [Rhizobium sp. CFBP 8762]